MKRTQLMAVHCNQGYLKQLFSKWYASNNEPICTQSLHTYKYIPLYLSSSVIDLLLPANLYLCGPCHSACARPINARSSLPPCKLVSHQFPPSCFPFFFLYSSFILLAKTAIKVLGIKMCTSVNICQYNGYIKVFL